MKKILCLISLTLMICLSSCSSDKDEPQSNLFDWRITKSVYEQTSGKNECVERKNETIYNQTEEYVQMQKAIYEAKSNQYFKYKYAYQKLN